MELGGPVGLYMKEPDFFWKIPFGQKLPEMVKIGK